MSNPNQISFCGCMLVSMALYWLPLTLAKCHQKTGVRFYEARRACPPGCLDQIKTARQDGLTTAPTFFRELNAFLFMFKFSDSYETYRICSQQYLHSIWIVFGCMGCWGVGWGCRTRHDGLTTDSRPIKTDQGRRTCLFAIAYLLNDVRIFRQLWNLQDMFTTIFKFALNSFWVYGVLGGGVRGVKTVTMDSRRTRGRRT